MRFPAALLCWTLPAAAAITGVAANGTTGKPQSGVAITLIKIGQGMVEIGKATTDAQGQFRIDAPPPSGELPYLVRGEFRGVNYHAPARASAAGGDIAVRVEVFDTTTDRATLSLARHQVIVEPRPGRLMVEELYTVNNSSKPPRTYTGSGTAKDTFLFTIADGKAEEVQASVSGGSQMPLKQAVLDRGESAYALDYPIRPGETRVDVSYRLPYDSSFVFRQRKAKGGLSGAPETIVIAPMDLVTLTSPALSFNRKEEKQGAAFYDWKSDTPVTFEIKGTLPELAADGADGGAGGDQQEQLATIENPNFVLLAGWKILVVLGVALALGLGHLYRLDVGAKTSK